jgi:hypothetical protein
VSINAAAAVLCKITHVPPSNLNFLVNICFCSFHTIPRLNLHGHVQKTPSPFIGREQPLHNPTLSVCMHACFIVGNTQPSTRRDGWCQLALIFLSRSPPPPLGLHNISLSPWTNYQLGHVLFVQYVRGNYYSDIYDTEILII